MKRALVSDPIQPLPPRPQNVRSEPGPLTRPRPNLRLRLQDDNNLREALKQGSLMLGELRTIALSPQKYYELYMQVWNELRHLEAFFGEEARHGKSNLELYELVQHAGNILPRLYLLITVGVVYVKSKDGAAKDVLKDLVEMAKGVQQPIHGLFLRTYLSQASKTLLPDTGSEYEGNGGNVNDAVEFVLQNFTEMNKLWVRMQHGGGNRDRERREKERRELRDLVGKNLLVLTQLEGMTLDLYKGTVMPRVLEQVINCKDDIAQPYLLDALIQVFPDEFHVQTLDAFLEACPLLKPTVKIGNVLASLMERLASSAQDNPEIVAQFVAVDAFGKLRAGCKSIIASRPSMDAHDRLQMHAALMGFVTAVHRDRLDYVDDVLGACADALNAPGGNDEKDSKENSSDERGDRGGIEGGSEDAGPPMIVSDQKGVRQLHALLTVPLETYDVVSVLGLSNYPRVMSLLQPTNLRQMAMTIVKSVIREPEGAVSDATQAETLFRFISVLIKDRESVAEEVDEEDFEEEQNAVARLVHALQSGDSDTQYRLLVASRKHFGQGGPRRLKHTLPPLAHEAMRLGRSLLARARADSEAGDSGAAAAATVPTGPMGPALKKILQFLHQTISALAAAPVSRHEQAMRLFLEAAQLADASGMEPVAYEFFERAMTIYEDEISDSAAQRSALSCVVGALHSCVRFTAESRETLVHKTTAYSARLLKKPDQVRAVADCAHLFWGPDGVDGAARDATSTVTCLKKALKIAGGVQQASLGGVGGGGGDALRLFIEVLNKYLYFFERGCPGVDASILQGLLEIINGELAGEEHGVAPDIQAYYGATVRHIKHQKLKGGEIGARYQAISL